MSELQELAYQWNTLPKYIYETKNGTWRNFEIDIIQVPSLINPIDFYNQAKATSTGLTLDTQDIITPWVLGNRAFHTGFQNLNYNWFFLETQVGIDPEVAKQIFTLWDNIRDQGYYSEFLRERDEEKQKFRVAFEDRRDQQERMDRSQPVETTPPQKDREAQVYTVELPYDTIEQLFNETAVSEQFPMLTLAEYYKVLNNFPYRLEVPEDDQTMFVVTTDRRRLTVEGIVDTPRRFRISGDSEVLKRDVIKQLFPRVLKQTFVETLVSAHFFVRNQIFNPIVWADLAMNNPLFRETMYIDEHVNAYTERTVFLHFVNPAVVCTMGQRGPDLRLRVLNAKTEAIIQEVADKLAKFLGLYNELGAVVVKQYNELLVSKLPAFETKPPATTKKQQTLRKLLPNHFPKGYSRKCGHPPRLVTEEEVGSLDPRTVMAFPTDGSPKYYFSCDNQPTHPFPRLLKKEPHLPCCFVQEQSDDTKVAEPRNPTQQRFLITDKFVGADQRGKIPVMLQALLGTKGYRVGMTDTSSSLLECVLMSLHGKRSGVGATRKRLSASPWLGKQEMWTDGLNEITRYIRSSEYLDPRRVKTMVEELLKCRVVLFSRTDFILPNFHSSYLRYAYGDGWPIVLIYENVGAESDVGTYPRCELLMDVPNVEFVYDAYVNALQTYEPNGEQTFFARLSGKVTAQHFTDYGKVWAVDIGGSTLVLPQLFPPMDVKEGSVLRPASTSAVVSGFKSLGKLEQSYLAEYQRLQLQALPPPITFDIDNGVVSTVSKLVRWAPNEVTYGEIPVAPDKGFFVSLEGTTYFGEPVVKIQDAGVVYIPQQDNAKVVLEQSSERDTYYIYSFPETTAFYRLHQLT